MSIPIPAPAPQPYFNHSPVSNLPYGWILTNLVDVGDSIASCVWTLAFDKAGGLPVVGATLTLGTIVNTTGPKANIAYGWLAIQDPTLEGKTIAGTCRYTTASGKVDERTMFFRIRYQ